MTRDRNLSADLVLRSGKIVTVDSGDTVAQALAVKGERFSQWDQTLKSTE